MGWFMLITIVGFVVGFSGGSGKAGGNLRQENRCEFCRAAMIFDSRTGSYALVCPRCGKTQNR